MFCKLKLIYLLPIIFFSSCQNDQGVQINTGKLVELRANRITTINWSENGLIMNVETIGGSATEYELNYDEENLISVKHQFNGELFRYISFIYKHDILVSLIKGPGAYDPRITITNFLYIDNKIVIQKDSLSGFPVQTEPWTVTTTTFEYDTNGNVIRVMKKDSAGLLLEEAIYQYDSKINPLYNKYFEFNWNGEIDFNLITPLNNVISIDITSLYDDLYISNSLTISYEYDKFNYPNIAHIIRTDADGMQVRVDFVYEE